jgi:hypothetical protein
MQRIVYLSWPATEIAGGIKVIFRHVEALREAGFTAFVATPDAKPPGWFETTAPILGLADLAAQTDVLVFPENHKKLLEHFAGWTNPKLVFCQNQYMVIRGLVGRRDYAEFGVGDLICSSQVTATYLRRRFPTPRIFIVPNYADRAVFRFQPTKRLQVAFIPRMRAQEAAVIHDLFAAENPQWRGLPWVQIDGMPEREVARILTESAVYLSLCRFESLPLTLLEGLASGCVTAGFTGWGGRDVATTKNGFWAAEDDCLDCVDQLTSAVRLAVEGGERLRDMVEAALATTQLFSRERFVASVTHCWKSLAPAAQATS